jgi:outer membrane protein OmpA-like peptidoglycan-associated protein
MLAVKAVWLSIVLALTRVPPAAPPAPAAQAPVVEPDRDKDRIPDSRDQCPDQPETYNGFEDDDGCPDKGRVITRICKIEIQDEIMFAANSVQLAPPGVELLDAIAVLLRGNPQIRSLEVRGHQVAGERAGMARARARAVVAALVARRVTTELTVNDRGRSEPICKRAGLSCSEQSRRVDFKILSVVRETPAP